MSRIVQYLMFFLMFSLTIGTVHYYLWMRLIRDPDWSTSVRRVATIAIIVAALSIPLTMFALRRLPFEIARWLSLPAFVWLGMMLLLFFFFLAADGTRAGISAVRKLRATAVTPSEPPAADDSPAFRASADSGTLTTTARTRRRLAAAAGLVVGLLTIYSVINALRPPTVIRQTVGIKNLPSAFDGYKIVQISDLHIGITVGGEWLNGVVEQVNALEPDLIAITGDLIDAPISRIWNEVCPLAGLRARDGVFFVTGNHEFFFETDRWVAKIESLGIRALRNAGVDIERGGQYFYLAGVDDLYARRFSQTRGQDVDAALAGRIPGRPVILLAHQPGAMKDVIGKDVDLTLAGHTHGGQIWPFTYISRIHQGYLKGLYRETDGSQLYINQGTFLWGPPMRLGTDGEITEITLTRRNGDK